MNTAAATNKVSNPTNSHSVQLSGSTVNSDIPVGGMDLWKRQAIQKVISFSTLHFNWDGHGGHAPGRAVRTTAIELLWRVPGESLPVPRVVPVSGGGYHFEWSVGDRELEISIDPDCRVEALRVENGIPIEDEETADIASLFAWLESR